MVQRHETRRFITCIRKKEGYNYRVCDEHFSEDAKFVAYHNRSNLKKTAVPSLFLPDSLEVEPGCSKRSGMELL